MSAELDEYMNHLEPQASCLVLKGADDRVREAALEVIRQKGWKILSMLTMAPPGKPGAGPGVCAIKLGRGQARELVIELSSKETSGSVIAYEGARDAQAHASREGRSP